MCCEVKSACNRCMQDADKAEQELIEQQLRATSGAKKKGGARQLAAYSMLYASRACVQMTCSQCFLPRRQRLGASSQRMLRCRDQCSVLHAAQTEQKGAGKAAAKKKRPDSGSEDDEDFMPQKKKKAPAKPKVKTAAAPEPVAVPAKAVPDIPFLVEKEPKVGLCGLHRGIKSASAMQLTGGGGRACMPLCCCGRHDWVVLVDSMQILSRYQRGCTLLSSKGLVFALPVSESAITTLKCAQRLLK